MRFDEAADCAQPTSRWYAFVPFGSKGGHVFEINWATESSLGVVAGASKAHISYWYGTNYDLKYATNASGT